MIFGFFSSPSHARTHQAVGEFHWYVSAYRLSFEDFSKGGEARALCGDEPKTASMFRVVFKSNLTRSMAEDLFARLNEIVENYKKEDEDDEPMIKSADDPRRNFIRAMSMRERLTYSQKINTKNWKPFMNHHSAC